MEQLTLRGMKHFSNFSRDGSPTNSQPRGYVPSEEGILADVNK